MPSRRGRRGSLDDVQGDRAAKLSDVARRAAIGEGNRRKWRQRVDLIVGEVPGTTRTLAGALLRRAKRATREERRSAYRPRSSGANSKDKS